MRTFVALLKREYLEHRSAFVIAPAVILALIVIAGLTFAPDRDWFEALTHSEQAPIDGDGRIFDGMAQGLDIAGQTDQELGGMLQMMLVVLGVPFQWVLLFVSLFALVASVYDERKDRSVLFWKSMPVSDTLTIISKYVFVAWIAPLATVLAVLLAKVFVLMTLTGYVEDGMGGRLWSHAGLFSSTVQLLFGYVLNGIVVLPVFGWFMLVAGYFNRAPFVWAIGIPFWLAIFEALTFETKIVGSLMRNHADMPTLPKLLGESTQGDWRGVSSLSDQLAVLGQGEIWAGIVLGVAFLAGAIYLRATRNQI